MTITPLPQVLQQNEMRELYHQRGMENYLKTCIEIPVPSPDTPARKLHEAFCCRKRTFRYLDQISKVEVALVSYVTYAPSNPKPPYNIISRLVIDNVRYEAALPVV